MPEILPSSKVATRLKSLTSDPIHQLNDSLGFRITRATFDPINDNAGVLGSGWPFSRGHLPQFNDDGSQPFPPEWVHGGPGFFTAKNPVYTSYSNAQPPTLYWQGGLDQVPGAGGNSLSSEFFDGDTRFYIVPDTFNPGGYHYEEALAGRDFIFEITDDLTITNNAILGGFEGYVNVFPPVDGYETWADNPVGMQGAGSNFSLNTWQLNVFGPAVSAGVKVGKDFPFIFGTEFLGTSAAYSTNAGAGTSAGQFQRGLEVVTQFDTYPSSALLGTEMGEYPQEFSMLVYDQKRNSHFKITLSSLAQLIAEVADGIGGITTGGLPAVNLTMPLLTTAQLNSYFNQTTEQASDLNADGSVSTADLLVFLTAFGSEDTGSAQTGFERFFDSTVTLHSGQVTDTAPFYSIDLNITPEDFENDVAGDGGDKSFGVIDMTLAPGLTNPLTTSGTSYFGLDLLGTPFSEAIFLDDAEATNYAAANVLLHLLGYIAQNGAGWDPDQDFGWTNQIAEIPFTSGPAPPAHQFVCDFKYFLDALNVWGATSLTQTLFTERYPRDDDEVLQVMTGLNYQHPQVSIIYEYSLPDIYNAISEPSTWPTTYNLSGYKPDALALSGGSNYEYEATYAANNQRIAVTIKGFIEIDANAFASKCLIYGIFSPPSGVSALVGIFGVATQTGPDPLEVDGFYRIPFEYTIDTQDWMTYSANHNSGGHPNPTTTYEANNFRAWPSSIQSLGQNGNWDAAFSIGAIVYGEPMNRVVITGTAVVVLNTKGEVV